MDYLNNDGSNISENLSNTNQVSGNPLSALLSLSHLFIKKNPFTDKETEALRK